MFMFNVLPFLVASLRIVYCILKRVAILLMATVHPLSICLNTFVLEEAGPRDYSATSIIRTCLRPADTLLRMRRGCDR